jgi:hypothetical protein
MNKFGSRRIVSECGKIALTSDEGDGKFEPRDFG